MFDAEVSPRHLSFVETGRSEPSREMVLRLAESLDLPLREQNALLEAAGYAQMYRETEISDPEMAQIRRILEFLLERHEPYPAIVVDRPVGAVVPHDQLEPGRPHQPDVSR